MIIKRSLYNHNN